MLSPLPTQISGARFLAQRPRALLADQPRVGKTGAALVAADLILAESILVVTTASGRGVWARAFDDWSLTGEKPQVLLPAKPVLKSKRIIVGWPSIADPKVRALLCSRAWDLVILDESHNAKNIETKRTQAAYGEFLDGGAALLTRTAVTGCAAVVWPLSGTPLPHSPYDAYPMLRALAPERLMADAEKGWPDVTRAKDFMHRYCIVRMKATSRFRKIPVVVGARNGDELKERMDGFLLRRTQADVGIRPPFKTLLPLLVTDRMRREADGDLDAAAILSAAEAGSTKDLELHLGPLRRVTGEIKARAVVDAVEDEFDGGLDKIVLAYWHRSVGDILEAALSRYGVVRLDGHTSADARDATQREFAREDGPRVFLGQIQAAGEAIDLSAAALLWFVETSFTPKDMQQMSLRITNHTQTRQAHVKVVTLAGSIDEAMQSRLMMLWTAIKEVLQ